MRPTSEVWRRGCPAAVPEMHRQVGPLKFGNDGMARRGVLVRHLVMPGQEEESAAIVEWLAEEVSRETFVNVMGQYQPQYEVGGIARDGLPKYATINRPPRSSEVASVYKVALAAGLRRFDERRARLSPL